VLESLAFSKQTLRESVLGLSMVLVISMIAAILFLDMNRLQFMALRHEGKRHKQVAEKLSS